MTWMEILESRLLQALVAGVFVAVGWLVNGWQNRKAAARLRAEKLRDYHRALYAEIASYVDNLESREAMAAWRDKVVAAMEADAAYIPFLPREEADTIFRTMLDQIHILPRVTIDPIVVYYAQVRAIRALVDDMRAPSFRELSPQRRILMYRDYVALKMQALDDGSFAQRMIGAYADGGREAAMAEDRKISREIGISS